jgi:hypothetical protein
MKKIIAFLTNKQVGSVDNMVLKTITIDLVTFGFGTIIFFSSLLNNYSDKAGASSGALLIILGVLIRIWKKEIK